MIMQFVEGRSQGLEIFDQVHAFLVGEPIAERVSLIAHSEPGGIDDELGLKRRAAGRQRQLVGADLGELPADVVCVVMREFGRGGPGEPCRAARRLSTACKVGTEPLCRYGAVAQMPSSGGA